MVLDAALITIVIQCARLLNAESLRAFELVLRHSARLLQ